MGASGNLPVHARLSSGKFAGADVPTLQIVFIRYASGLVVVLAIILARRIPWRGLSTPSLSGHVARAFFGVAGVGCSLYASTHMPLVDASAVALTRGAFVVLLAAWILREHISIGHCAGIAVSFLGALVAIGAVRPEGVSLPKDMAPAAVGAAGALLIAAEVILIKTLSGRDRPITVLLYVHLFGALMLAGPALFAWRAVDARTFLGLLALGPLAVLAQYCTIRGYRLAKASLLAPMSYSRIIFAALIGFVVFNERPTAATLVGGAMVILGSLWLTFAHREPPGGNQG